MSKMPGVTWRPIPVNFTRGGQPSVRGVVLHIMAGTLAGTDAWFRNSAAEASSHFGTGKAGAPYQWVNTADKAWAQAGGNPSRLSIENEGQDGDALTNAQLDRCAEVLARPARSWPRRWSLRKGRAHRARVALGTRDRLTARMEAERARRRELPKAARLEMPL